MISSFYHLCVPDDDCFTAPPLTVFSEQTTSANSKLLLRVLTTGVLMGVKTQFSFMIIAARVHNTRAARNRDNEVSTDVREKCILTKPSSAEGRDVRQ